MTSQSPDAADFLSRAVSPYHTVAAAEEWLESAGFQRLGSATAAAERTPGKYFFRKGGKTLVAWVRNDPEPQTAFRIVSAHSDFPTLRVKQTPLTTAHGLRLLRVEPYGGPITQTWLDRELTIAGSVVLRDGDGLRTELARSDGPICRTASLPAHLRTGDKASLKVNPQTDLNCILGTAEAGPESIGALLFGADDPRAAAVIEHDLNVVEGAAPAVFGGEAGLLSGSRLDNLTSCYSSLAAIADREPTPGAPTPMVAIFDAEEIGSGTWSGAQSRLMDDLTRMLSGEGAARIAALEGSTHISLDVAHARNPMHAQAYDEEQAPSLGEGVALKYSSRGGYAYSPGLAAHLRALAEELGQPLQEFTYRSDQGRGGSLGPYVAAALGVRTVDMGVGILSMHSIRESCSLADLTAQTALLRAHFASDWRPPASGLE